jgi:AcrR family transcriptional regulator
MRERITWTPAESAPPRAEALRLQGLPPGREPAPRIVALLEEALAEYAQTAEPRALVEEISREEFAEVYHGEGRNAPATPLELVYPRAERLALFVATVGEPVTQRIRGRFAEHHPAAGAMLDSVASAAADGLAERLAERFQRLARAEGAAGAGDAAGLRALPYSPGYCGWHVSGQRRLFARLRPEEIGVTLNASCLMRPLKSVSGVLVRGPASIHRFTPDYPFCADCAERPCRVRLAAAPGA